MAETSMDLTVRSITHIDREKKDLNQEKVKVIARDAEGQYTASFEGPKGSFQGLRPEMQVTVKLVRSQQTIQESVEKEKTVKKKK